MRRTSLQLSGTSVSALALLTNLSTQLSPRLATSSQQRMRSLDASAGQIASQRPCAGTLTRPDTCLCKIRSDCQLMCATERVTELLTRGKNVGIVASEMLALEVRVERTVAELVVLERNVSVRREGAGQDRDVAEDALQRLVEDVCEVGPVSRRRYLDVAFEN